MDLLAKMLKMFKRERERKHFARFGFQLYFYWLVISGNELADLHVLNQLYRVAIAK